MVISAEKEDSRLKNMNGLVENRAYLSPSRRSVPQSRLHNFSFPTLSWGNQKLLRCVKPSGRSIDEEQAKEAKESNPLGLSASTRWNLRSKRAARNAPTEIFWNRNTSPSSSQSQSFSYSPIQKEKTSNPVFLVTRLEGFDVVEKGERRKFSIALSREEIEEDFLAAKGTKPPRRPKKRAKYLQRQLDALFPGAFLSEVTSDLYKIEEIGS